MAATAIVVPMPHFDSFFADGLLICDDLTWISRFISTLWPQLEQKFIPSFNLFPQLEQYFTFPTFLENFR